MGSYFELSVDDRVIWSEKNSISLDLDVFFLEEDKFENPIAADESDYRELDVDVGYRVSLRVARFRLALRGYTIAKAREKYDSWAAEKRKPSSEYDEPEKLSDAFYSKYSFRDYVALLKRVHLNDDVQRILSADEEYVVWPPLGYSHGFPAKDPHYVLSVLVHSIDGDHLEVCLSDMIAGEFWDSAWQLDAWDRYLIILTEGKTDTDVLRDAFRLLYPDHFRTMRFFDYHFRPQGGASNNVNLLKSFAAAGISSPVLAIFDNDTAGHKALQDARALSLPDNFMMASYPDIELARHYPTLGPSGLEQLDVNQSACGIEMYLGSDCLTKGGALIPVRWTGYDEVMRRYQGKVGDKNHVLKSFREKIKAYRDRPLQSSQTEWRELRSIMETIETVVLGECLDDD